MDPVKYSPSSQVISRRFDEGQGFGDQDVGVSRSDLLEIY